jgi:hypothetical protein
MPQDQSFTSDRTRGNPVPSVDHRSSDRIRIHNRAVSGGHFIVAAQLGRIPGQIQETESEKFGENEKIGGKYFVRRGAENSGYVDDSGFRIFRKRNRISSLRIRFSRDRFSEGGGI